MKIPNGQLHHLRDLLDGLKDDERFGHQEREAAHLTKAYVSKVLELQEADDQREAQEVHHA